MKEEGRGGRVKEEVVVRERESPPSISSFPSPLYSKVECVGGGRGGESDVVRGGERGREGGVSRL